MDAKTCKTTVVAIDTLKAAGMPCELILWINGANDGGWMDYVNNLEEPTLEQFVEELTTFTGVEKVFIRLSSKLQVEASKKLARMASLLEAECIFVAIHDGCEIWKAACFENMLMEARL